jgi:hypothetical protein
MRERAVKKATKKKRGDHFFKRKLKKVAPEKAEIA